MRSTLIDKLVYNLEYYNSCLRKEDFGPKVFCIGYNKTGTTSCGAAFRNFGFKNSSFNPKVFKFYKEGRIDKVLNYTSKFDSFDDLPWLKSDMIPILDDRFPKSRFVHLKRDELGFKNSLINWRKKNRGLDTTNLDQKLEKFQEHNSFVKQYFLNREEDFISIDIFNDNNAIKKLSKFLNVRTDLAKFPHKNITEK